MISVGRSTGDKVNSSVVDDFQFVVNIKSVVLSNHNVRLPFYPRLTVVKIYFIMVQENRSCSDFGEQHVH